MQAVSTGSQIRCLENWASFLDDVDNAVPLVTGQGLLVAAVAGHFSSKECPGIQKGILSSDETF